MSAQVLRNRKALCTTTLIVILFTLCWIPYCLYESLVYILREIHVIAFSMAFNKIYRILFLLVLLNSFLDPFIYAARMREIQKGQCRLLAVVAYLGSSLTIHYSAQACERSIAISLFVCLSVCLPASIISGTAAPIFTRLFLQIPCGSGSVLLWRRCDVMYFRFCG